MKRIVLLVGLFLAGGASTALADQLAPPSGPGSQGQEVQRRHHRQRLSPQVRQQLLQRFDRDGDGRLDRRERRAAKRFVKRLRHQHRAHRR